MEPVSDNHQFTLIFLHGLPGDSLGALHQFIPYNSTYMVPETTRIILPNSPASGWYRTHGDKIDISSLGHIQEAIYDYVDQGDLNT